MYSRSKTEVEEFNLDEQEGLTVPTWVTPKQFPLEIRQWAHYIVVALGQILGVNTANAEIPSFVIALDQKWELSGRMMAKPTTSCWITTHYPLDACYVWL